MKRILLVVVSLFIISTVSAQESIGGNPLSFSIKLNDHVPSYHLEALDVEALLAEDEGNGKNGTLERYGVVRPVEITMYNEGVWTELENGDRVWRLRINSEDAKATSLLFENFYLPNGSKLFIYEPNENQIIGAFTSINNHHSKQFATELIYGSECVIEYFEPNEERGNGEFLLTGVVHQYKQTPWDTNVEWFGSSDPCEVNVNCSEGNAWQDVKKGVARIQMSVGSSVYFCTGSLVNNTNQDCRPYFLTAFHCIEGFSASTLNNFIFYFNFESSGCSTPSSQSTITNSPSYFSVNGCSLVSGSNNGGSSSSDFALLEFNSNIPASHANDVYYNGWDRTNLSTVTSNGVGIHHPAGDIKKISTYTQSLTTSSWNNNGLPSHYQVVWAATSNGHGVTEGGSSGSPIFNSQGLIIGTLTGGSSCCTSNGCGFGTGLNSPDYYGKVSYHWNSNGSASNRRLDIHLDPAGNGSATSLAGSASPCTATLALDASISSILEPSTDICGSSFTPQVVLRNAGTSTLTTCQIRYQVTGSGILTYNWTGSLATNATTTVTLNTLNAALGTNTFTATTQSPNGGTDQNTSNDSQSETFDAIAGGPLPVVQSFQAGTFPPANYDIFNGDNNITWERTTSAGANSSASMFMDNWDYNNPGAYDWFVLPAVDLTTVSNPTMTYDYAYAYYDGQQGTFYDSLIIAYSTDCGNSWFGLSFEGGVQLATAGGQNTEFTPTSSQWENVSLDLNSLAVEENVLFAFVAVNGYGNNLYVDNINIQGGSTTTPPIASFTSSTNSICEGDQVTFNSTSSGNPTTFSWSFPGGTPSTSNQSNPVVTYNSPGTYSVTLTVSNGGGSDTETQLAYMSVASGPNLTTSSTPAACTGINTGTATVLATGAGGNYTYSWVGSPSIIETATNLAPGTYSVTVVGGNGCSSSSNVTVGANVDVNVQLNVVDSSAAGGTSSISSAVSGGTLPYSYLWNIGDTTSSITNIGVGSYTLTVTDDAGCTGTASASIGGVAVQEVDWLEYVSLYPNPTSSNLSLDIALIQTEDLRIEILNALGQILVQKELKAFQSGLTQFNVQDFAEGVYFVRLSNQNATKILRFVKKN